ncbi:MAG: AAA family ATPase [Lewinellaceae bacterium]|nr:AAA family ATPase [Lewinellaceae bacterium]
MIQKVKIQNFKSVQSLELELGRINVFIGENGCGKTNILEAIAMGSAAVENKVDNEFLGTRGIRVTDPEFMSSAFEAHSKSSEIKVSFSGANSNLFTTIIENRYPKWIVLWADNEGIIIPSMTGEFVSNIFSQFDKAAKPNEALTRLVKVLSSRNIFIENSEFSPFLIFSPENSQLREFSDAHQILPLGIGGEGLFKHLATLFRDKPELFEKIKKQLEIIDWFEGLEIPKNLMFTERRVNIKDRFLHPDLQYFDQRSSNEGFLYLLFYFTLFISDATPKFFAIDNIDNALNPKLCSNLIKTLTRLAKEHEKQVIVTTHNPAILDGLDLNDDDQRLFVIYRNADGRTVAKRVQKREPVNGVESIRLSEAFIRGYLGGLPKNF